MSQGHRGRGRPRNTWKRDLEREMWTAGFRFSWRKMETAAQDEAGWKRVVCDTLAVTRLKKLGICSLERQRLRGDLIETFKILTGREHVNHSNFFELANVTSGLRGHSLKLFKPRCRTTVRQNFFSLRIINEWNKLSQDVVEASSVNMFKNRPDRHWQDMGI